MQPDSQFDAPIVAQNNSNQKSRTPLIIVIILLSMLLVAAIIIIIILLTRPQPDPKAATEQGGTNQQPDDEPDSDGRAIISDMYNVWLLKDNSKKNEQCFAITPDERFYWLVNCNDYEHNFYFGSVSIIGGKEALAELNIDKTGAIALLGIKDSQSIKTEKIFVVNVTPQISEPNAAPDGLDEIKEGIVLLFAITDDGQGYAYRYDTKKKYSFEANNDGEYYFPSLLPTDPEGACKKEGVKCYDDFNDVV